MKVDGEVFYEELNSFSVSNACDFIKTLILRRSGLVEDLHELGRKIGNWLIKLLFFVERWTGIKQL